MSCRWCFSYPCLCGWWFHLVRHHAAEQLEYANELLAADRTRMKHVVLTAWDPSGPASIYREIGDGSNKKMKSAIMDVVVVMVIMEDGFDDRHAFDARIAKLFYWVDCSANNDFKSKVHLEFHRCVPFDQKFKSRSSRRKRNKPAKKNNLKDWRDCLQDPEKKPKPKADRRATM